VDITRPTPLEKPDKISYYASSFGMAKLNDEMKLTFEMRDCLTRCWLKVGSGGGGGVGEKEGKGDGNGDVSGDMVVRSDGQNDTLDGKDPGSVSGMGSVSGRFLTPDVTDLMGSEWRLLR
jgi:hypothetical protein